ncbi:hypothetical protein ACLOJK_017563 [Asimina triloba]
MPSGHDSRAGCPQETLDLPQEKDSACGNSTVARESSGSPDTSKLAPENPQKKSQDESLCELPKTTPVDSIEESSFNSLLLYQEVTNRGGYEQVTKLGRWREVASALNLKIETPNLAFILQHIYVSLLEQMYILTMQQEKVGQVQGTDLSKEDSLCQASGCQDMEREHMQDFVAPSAEDTGADLSRIVTGRIVAKFGNKYLITVQVGSGELHGLLCEECSDDWSSVVSQIGKTAGSNLDPELSPDSQCKALAKRKWKGGQKKKATKKDPCAPRRIRSSFIYFLKEHLKNEHLKKEHHRTNREMVADVWKRLSLNERLPFIEKSRKEKESCKQESSPDAPKKARTAYGIFYSEQVCLLKKPDRSSIMKKAASIWKSLSENERQPYTEENLKDRERYKREMAAYKELQDAQNRNTEDRSCQSKSSNDDCYHVSLQTEQQTEEYFVKDEPATEEHLIKNEDLLDASQMMGWELSESPDMTA